MKRLEKFEHLASKATMLRSYSLLLPTQLFLVSQHVSIALDEPWIVGTCKVLFCNISPDHNSCPYNTNLARNYREPRLRVAKPEIIQSELQIRHNRRHRQKFDPQKTNTSRKDWGSIVVWPHRPKSYPMTYQSEEMIYSIHPPLQSRPTSLCFHLNKRFSLPGRVWNYR